MFSQFQMERSVSPFPCFLSRLLRMAGSQVLAKSKQVLQLVIRYIVHVLPLSEACLTGNAL